MQPEGLPRAETPKKLLPDPVIVIGMHRSGTSLVSRKLVEAGVLMGANLTGGHSESQFFLQLNKRLFALSHAEWDNPEPVSWLMSDPALVDAAIDTLRAEADLEHLTGHFDEGVSTSHPYPTALSWGWKDPRTSYTLPLWLRLFPNAKIVHVIRHGVDVAASLVTREQKRKFRFDSPARSVRCLEADRAFALWEHYVQQCETNLQLSAKTQSLTLTYEDLLVSPIDTLSRLLNFVEVPSSMTVRSDTCVRLANDIDASRHLAHRHSPEYAQMADRKQQSSAVLKRYYTAPDTVSAVA